MAAFETSIQTNIIIVCRIYIRISSRTVMQTVDPLDGMSKIAK